LYDYFNTNWDKLITEIIENISITHKNNTCFLSAITLGLFISFKKNGIKLLRWGHKLVEYLLSKEFDDIIKENKMYNTQFSGSINLRTPLQASAVATKGHFYQVSPVVKDQLANIHNRKGETIKPDQANDDLIYLDR
jgi:ADP-ribosylglycohydrolase